MNTANGNGGQQMVRHPNAGAETPLTFNSDPKFRFAMEPTTLVELNKVAIACAMIKLCGVQTAEEALARLLTGRELGLTMMQSMRGINMIPDGQGGFRPSLDASLMHAICLTSPICDDFEQVVSDGKKATYRVKRIGKTAKEYTFTIEEAAQAKLLNRGADPSQNNWNKWPKRMLEARAKALGARSEFPDLMFGMYAREELSDGDIVDMVPEGAPVGTAPVVHAAARNYESELIALTRQIDEAKTSALKSAVRKALEAWDAPPEFLDRAKAHYNASIKKPAPPAAAPSAPAPVPPVPPSAPAVQESALKACASCKRGIGAEVVRGRAPGSDFEGYFHPDCWGMLNAPQGREPGSDDE